MPRFLWRGTTRVDAEREVAMKRNRTFSTPKPVTVIHTSAAEHRFDTLRPVKVIHISAADQLIRGILCDHHETKPGVRTCNGVQI
ncbi:uncharacterized protein LOC119765639 isoform X2 [Culex quinquefasciatus]|uniref:uncharacterized protein LOC119765639 isoform X2 n=1 Tax=Culex quinquefasciatus TaxID=7176 RepID=UPI0018E2F58F|nr:uncharacterized protein LOC119765639 isoform X2 [Culex quinquefasciatus]